MRIFLINQNFLIYLTTLFKLMCELFRAKDLCKLESHRHTHTTVSIPLPSPTPTLLLSPYPCLHIPVSIHTRFTVLPPSPLPLPPSFCPHTPVSIPLSPYPCLHTPVSIPLSPYPSPYILDSLYFLHPSVQI